MSERFEYGKTTNSKIVTIERRFVGFSACRDSREILQNPLRYLLCAGRLFFVFDFFFRYFFPPYRRNTVDTPVICKIRNYYRGTRFPRIRRGNSSRENRKVSRRCSIRTHLRTSRACNPADKHRRVARACVGIITRCVLCRLAAARLRLVAAL